MAYGPDGPEGDYYPDAAPGPRYPRPVDASTANWVAAGQQPSRPRPRPQPRPEATEPPRPVRPRPQDHPSVPPQRGTDDGRPRRAATDRRTASSEATARANRRKGKKPRRAVTRARKIRRYTFRSLAVVLVIALSYVGYTIEPYLTYAGTDSVAARVAEWGRDHHLSWAVTWLENTTYKAPPTGGKLSSQQVQQLQGATVAPSQAAKDDLPANIQPLAAGSVPGEGVWHPVVMGSLGVPVVEVAGLRPDAQHTSALAYVAWMSQKALKFQLHPGSQQPGGTFTTPDQIPAGQRTGLVATWNGGFKVNPNDSLSGYYEDGVTVKPLVDGKASEVFYKDGTVKIGQWGRDVTMTPQVTGVRQNLSLLVNQGQETSAANSGSGAEWGVTVNNAFFVPRSGVGITASGDIIYVGGPDLSVNTLALLLKQAGAVEGMELDINADWTSYMYYNVPVGGDPLNPSPTKLWDFKQAADRYYQPSSRDFVAAFMR